MRRIRLKTKLTLGLSFLFVVILAFGILGLFYINKLTTDAGVILKDNYNTLQYCNNMLKALEELPGDSSQLRIFQRNLFLQKKNITEPGELEATQFVEKNFNEMKADPADTSNYKDIRRAIFNIQQINQEAIFYKNKVASDTARDANLWLTMIVTILTIVAFTFIVNFPGIISNPLKALSEGITAIANKNYGKRIHIKQNDEFGDLADAFNTMASKLDDYENSNLANILFEKTRIETIINQMKDGIIGFDEKKNILFMNAVAENLFSLKEKEIAGKYAPDIALRNDLMRTILQDGEKKELKIYADAKESFFTKEHITVQNGELKIGEVIVLRNITPFHELDEAKTNFIATVSHELKTPLSSIKMSAKLLSDERVSNLNSEQKELVQSISDDAERLLKITGELLNMAQVETGNIQLKLQSTNVFNIVMKASNAVQSQLQQKNISLRTNIQPQLPPINVDAEKTSWVLINFLTNAIKFSKESSSIEIKVLKKNTDLIFSVKDEGIGIDKKYLPKIFDRYFKVPGQDQTGTGLGLAISNEFIEAQGGKIWAESELEKGSLFAFSLPVNR
jgi:signal transduction histidine kinase